MNEKSDIDLLRELEPALEYVPLGLSVVMKSYEIIEYIKRDKNGWARRNQSCTKVITCTKRDGSTYPHTIVGNPISNAIKEALEESEYECEDVRLHPTGCVCVSKNKFIPSIQYDMIGEKPWDAYTNVSFAESIRDIADIVKEQLQFNNPRIWRRKKTP
jgi:hypothetical protein